MDVGEAVERTRTIATGEKKGSRADQRERSKATILKTAISFFAERGYAGVSLDEMASHAGVRRTLLLYYYKSKDELWRCAATEVSAAFNAVLAKKLSTAGGNDDEERSRSTLLASLDAYLEQPDFARFLVREGGMPSDRLDFLVEHFNYAKLSYDNPELNRVVGTTIMRDVMFSVFLSMAALGPLMEASLSRVSGRRRSGVYPMTKRNRQELVTLLTRFMTSFNTSQDASARSQGETAGAARESRR